MRRRKVSIGLPLLMRELSDQAGRARHYVLRTLFATALLSLGFLYISDLVVTAARQGNIFALGFGPMLFNRIIGLEMLGVVIFLPAMTCGAIAGEKERNTLAVLLTTRLNPATIVLEKLLSRLVVVLSLLLISVPLLSFAYALGGLSLDYMLRTLAWLLGMSLMIATLSLMCSAWSGSTVSAFFMTYALGGIWYIGWLGYLAPRYADAWLRGGPMPTVSIFLLGLLFPSAVFFLVTVRCLVQRASVTPRNFLLSFFRWLDQLFVRMNVVVGNIVLTREKSTLPDTQPIAWRETAKKSLGTVRYLVRILVSIEFPTVFLLVLAAEMPSAGPQGAGVRTFLWLAIWCISAVLISVMCGGIISGEQTRQTLPVLLSTPIPGPQILRELFAGVRRLIFVLWIPFVTIIAFDHWYHIGRRFRSAATISECLLCDVLQLTIYPFLIAWVTFYLGSKVRSPLWGIMVALLTVTGVVAGPFLLLWLVGEVSPVDLANGTFSRYVALASPAAIIVSNEYAEVDLSLIGFNFLIYGSALFAIRRFCLRRADQLLGRCAEPVGQPTPRSSAALPDVKVMTHA